MHVLLLHNGASWSPKWLISPSFIFCKINGDRKSQELHLSTLRRIKDPSRQVINFRHSLGCHTIGTLLSKQCLLRNSAAPLRCWKWNVPYRIGFWNGPNPGYVHTEPDRFLLRFKSCSGTVWTRINILLRCKNCSEAFPVWTEALSVTQFATLPFDLKGSFTNTRFHCNFCSDRSVQTYSDRLKNLSDTERSTLNSWAEQYCSGPETASKAVFLVWTEALSGTLPATLRFTFWYSVNIASVWTLLSEQKLQRNLVLVNYLFKSKGSAANS